MRTRNQLRAEIYNALITDAQLSTIVGNRIYWIYRPTTNNTFPLLTYHFLNSASSYAHSNSQPVDNLQDVQITIYGNVGKATEQDNIIKNVSRIMNNLLCQGERIEGEFHEEEINKNVAVMRFTKLNV